MFELKSAAHLTSAHARYDVRIFKKECVSLASNGYRVSLVVADGKGDEVRENVAILDAGASRGRLHRIRTAPGRVFSKAMALNADVYHLHDPELLPVGIKLKKAGRRVIFDMHENLDLQILEKKWIPSLMRPMVSRVYRLFELYAIKKFDALIVPQVAMREKFTSLIDTFIIANFPTDLTSMCSPKRGRYDLIYAGGISEARGIFNMLDLIVELKKIDERYRLIMAGLIDEESRSQVESHPGWRFVDYIGYAPQDEVYRKYSESSIGLILFNNVGQYHMAYSLKLFEYMQNGLFVVMPNFGDWIDFQRGSNAGACVDVKNAPCIAKLIDGLTDDEISEVGEGNICSVQDRFNWKSQEGELRDLYSWVISGRG